MTNMKTEMNHNLLTQTIEKRKCMEYSEQTVKLIAIVIEHLRNNKMEKLSSFAETYFLHEIFFLFGQEGRDAITNEMDQIYRQTCFVTIYIKYLTPQ